MIIIVRLLTINSTTLSNVTSHSITNCPQTIDYVAYVLGVIAIAIAIYSYVKQKKWNDQITLLTKKIVDLTTRIDEYITEQKKIEDSVKQVHLLSISNSANMAKWQLNFILDQLAKKSGMNLKEMIETYGALLNYYSQDILQHCNNLNFRIMSPLFQELDSVGKRIRRLSNLNELKGYPDEQQEWESYAKDTIGIIGDATTKIYQALGLPEPQ